MTRSISSQPVDRMLVHRRVTSSIKFAGTHLDTWVERGNVIVKFPSQGSNPDRSHESRVASYEATVLVEITQLFIDRKDATFVIVPLNDLKN